MVNVWESVQASERLLATPYCASRRRLLLRPRHETFCLGCGVGVLRCDTIAAFSIRCGIQAAFILSFRFDVTDFLAGVRYEAMPL